MGMHIIWIFGNGLDLGLGLRTSYRDFYSYMKENASKDNIILKKYIEDVNDAKIELWSDYEKRLGEITKLFFEEQIDTFIDNKLEIDECLKQYLMSENTKLNFSENDYKQLFTRGMQSIVKNKKAANNNKINALLSKQSRADYFVYPISFNYTDTVKNIFSIDSKIINNIRINNYPIGSYHVAIGEPLYIHGTIFNYEMVIGVNDANQIKNSLYSQNSNIQNALIKNNLLNIAGQMKYDTFIKYIKNADIICLYGLSFGETDSNYYKAIKQSMLDYHESMLIIYYYDDSYIERDIISDFNYEEKAKHKFFDVSEANEEECKALNDRIVVFLNTCVFSNKALNEL